jgi:hypothetical protein
MGAVTDAAIIIKRDSALECRELLVRVIPGGSGIRQVEREVKER